MAHGIDQETLRGCLVLEHGQEQPALEGLVTAQPVLVRLQEDCTICVSDELLAKFSKFVLAIDHSELRGWFLDSEQDLACLVDRIFCLTCENVRLDKCAMVRG